jgi:hypothetical protein
MLLDGAVIQNAIDSARKQSFSGFLTSAGGMAVHPL